MRTTRLLTTATATALLGLLTSCGGLHPGTAVSLGEQSISTSDVERLSTAYCASVEDGLKANTQAVPMSYVRSSVVTNLVLRAIADGIGEEYGVGPGANYASSVAAAETRSATYEPEAAEAYVEITTSSAYLQDVVTAAATKALEAEGVSDPSGDQVNERAREMFTAYPGEHGLEIDPAYGLEFTDGQFAPADTGVSFGDSEVATRAQGQEEAPQFAFELPDAHRCG